MGSNCTTLQNESNNKTNIINSQKQQSFLDRTLQESDCTSSDPSKCIRLARLCNIMHLYCNQGQIHTNMVSILDDYLHLLRIHNNNDQEFEYIMLLLGVCGIKTCRSFTRHYGNRNTFNLYKNDYCNVTECQILDKIHCFYSHPIDHRHQLSVHEINNDITHTDYLVDKTKYIQSDNKVFERGVIFKYGSEDDDCRENCISVEPKYNSLTQAASTMSQFFHFQNWKCNISSTISRSISS
eukprot:378648_1